MDKYKMNKEIVESFVSEGLDLLESAEVKIGKLEQGYDDEMVNTIFRMFHSIKGSAGFLQLDNIKSVTHEAETLLDIYRNKNEKPKQEEVDLMYQTCDFLRQLIVNVEKTLSDKGYENDAEIIIHGIQESIKNLKVDLQNTAPSNALPPKKINQKELEQLQESIVTPEMIDRYISESLDSMDSLEKGLLDLEKTPYNQEIVSDIFRKVHSFKGNSGFLGYSELHDAAMEMETLLDHIRTNQTSVNNKVINTLLGAIDFLRKGIQSIKSDGVYHPQQDKDMVMNSISALMNLKPTSGIFKPLGEILVEMGAVTEDGLENALNKQKKRVGELLIENGVVSEDKVNEALEIQKRMTPTIADGLTAQFQRKDIRVDTVKLDKLFNLIGELITAEVMVTNNQDLTDMNLPNFHKSAKYLNKITRELQEITMLIRMVPLEALFNKMTRLVRDLSKKANKEIDFRIYGAETEMDRNVIEEISDPLVHILRNAIDHGIESKEARKEAGKKETGSVRLEARYESSEIWIVVEDDGAGLNREKILAKAVERNLVAREGMDKMTDDEVWQLIFSPGFSTADSVTDISGRGVGMDVVKKNIEKIRGRVEIQSVSGKGSQFILKIPLTLAIMDGINVRVGQNRYSIPISDIVQSLKIKKSQLTRTEGDNEVVKVREDLIPILKLYEIFNVTPDYRDASEGIIMIVQNGGKKAGLLLDEIIGNQQIVIKSLSDYLGNIPGIMGCSILGSGEISLIIDVGGLIKQFVD